MYIDSTLDDEVDEKDLLRTKQPSRTKEPLAPQTTSPNADLIQAENELLDIGRRDPAVLAPLFFDNGKTWKQVVQLSRGKSSSLRLVVEDK
jgi:hypothetical protein